MRRVSWIGLLAVSMIVTYAITTAHMRARAADAVPVAAATAPAAVSHADIDPMIGELVNLAGEGRIDQMLDRIGPTPEPDREAIEHARERLMAVYNNFGKYRGF